MNIQNSTNRPPPNSTHSQLKYFSESVSKDHNLQVKITKKSTLLSSVKLILTAAKKVTSLSADVGLRSFSGNFHAQGYITPRQIHECQ